MADRPASIVIDEASLRRMARDAAVYSLTRPWAVAMWAALLAAFAVSIVALTRTAPTPDLLTSWMPVAVLALAAYAVWLTTTSARRAVRAAMPAGSTVWVQPGQTALRVGVARRTSEIPYETFQSLRVARDAVLLKIPGASAVTAFPRALFSDEDLTLVRSRIREMRPRAADRAIGGER